MVDRKNVIHDLPICIDFAESRGYGGLVDVMRDALELLKAEEAKPLRCGGCSRFTQTQESGVGYCSFPNFEREVFDTEYCSWGAWTGKEG